MKKIRIVSVIGCALFILYILLIISELIWGYLEDTQLLLFSSVLAVISIIMLYKGVLIKSASTLWFAICLILFAISLVVFELVEISVEYYYLLSLLPIIASIVNIAIFHNLFYIKVIIINLSIFIPLLVTQFVLLDWWWVVLIYAISIVLGIILCRNLSLEKEKIHG